MSFYKLLVPLLHIWKLFTIISTKFFILTALNLWVIDKFMLKSPDILWKWWARKRFSGKVADHFYQALQGHPQSKIRNPLFYTLILNGRNK